VETGKQKSSPLSEGYRRGFAFAPDNQGFYYAHESHVARGTHTIRYCSLSGNASDHTVFSRPRSPGSSLMLISDDQHLDGRIDYHYLDIIASASIRIENLMVNGDGRLPVM
jgi:hypothetical protein